MCFDRSSTQNQTGRNRCFLFTVEYKVDQLSDIFHYIFTQSLKLHKVPELWKHSVIAPVGKSNTPKALNNFRPVALTSLVMESFEKNVKKQVLTQVVKHLDPSQFAYRTGRGVDDVVNTLLHYLYGHLEGTKTLTGLLFSDFSTAFNTIQPFLLAEWLIKMDF